MARCLCVHPHAALRTCVHKAPNDIAHAAARRLQAAGVNATAIAGLQACDFTDAATLPSCLVEILSTPG